MTNKSLILGVVAALIGTGLVAPPVQAQTVVISNNLGPGNTYNLGAVHALDSSFEQAVAFTPVSNFMPTQIDVGIDTVSSSSAPDPAVGVTLSLEGSLNGVPSGTPLASFRLTGLPTGGTGNTGTIQPSQIARFTEPTQPVEVFKNTQYWLVASVFPADSVSVWNLNFFGTTGGSAFNDGPGTSFFLDSAGVTPAFAVLGTPLSIGSKPPGVPEPPTLGLMALGLLAAGFAGSKRRR